MRGRRETPLELAERIGDAYGLVLILILTTFVVTMTLPPEGWGGRVAAVALIGVQLRTPTARVGGGPAWLECQRRLLPALGGRYAEVKA